ncbi:hypothetical protein CYY_000742 [Polysphondylium violaceum]|uniref:F-box domain-containing protein n=1 Tax=Polysphondylium violaceum TaxID=133409 RepID=A0A8J4UWW0_9MYCE|nr:hypothetical protein CYY_000742 [Polysphondylium violaceum]
MGNTSSKNKFLQNLIQIDVDNGRRKFTENPDVLEKDGASIIENNDEDNQIIVQSKKKYKKDKKNNNYNNNDNSQMNLIHVQDRIVLISNNDTNHNNQLTINHMPESLIYKIIKYAVGDIFPSKHFFKISRVSRLFCKLSLKSIKNLFYDFPYLYETNKHVNHCKIVSRFLAIDNHYFVKNNIQNARLGFGLDSVGFCLMYPQLMECKTLRSLRILFYHSIVPKERIKSVLNILIENHNIRKLNISQDVVHEKTCKYISMVIGTDLTNIKELVYQKAKINSEKFELLMKGCTRSTTLKFLDFSKNVISDENLDLITHYLENSKTLEYLDLSNNQISDVGCHLIIQACKKSKSIKKLNLSGNLVPNDQIESFNIEYSKHFVYFRI